MKSKKPFNRQNSWRCIEYWLARGYTEEQGRQEIAKRQVRKPEVYRKAAEAKKTPEFREFISKKMKKVYTLDYWIEKLGPEEGQKKYNELEIQLKKNGRKVAKNRTPQQYRENSIRCIEYWLNRGYTSEEAREEIAIRQSRGLEHYISKYGEHEGTFKWKKRQSDWQKSLYANNDIDEINSKRRANAHIGVYTSENAQHISELTFYLVKMISSNERFLKFGLTKHPNGATGRWGHTKYGATVIPLVEWKTSGCDALQLEQSIKKHFSVYAYVPQLFNTTEALLEDCEENLRKYIQNVIIGNNGDEEKYDVENQNNVCGIV